MKVLPFYTSTAMRDAERVNSHDALLCPVHKVLPFQIQRDHLTSTYLTEIKLVDCDANETDIFDYFFTGANLITGWTNAPAAFDYDTFNSSGTTILTAIEAGSALAWCYSNEFTLATGDAVVIQYDLTLNSGDLPNIGLSNSAGSIYSDRIDMVAGAHAVYIKATANSSGNVAITVKNNVTDDTSFACSFAKVAYDDVLTLKEFTSYDFLTYNGEPLSTTLPYGVYYLKIVDSITTWYSDWFNVQNIQPQLLTSWVSNTYSSFVVSTGINAGVDILSATGAASDIARSNNFTSHTDEIFALNYDFASTGGANVRVFLSDPSVGGTYSNFFTLEDGLNSGELTMIGSPSGSSYLRITELSPGGIEWSLTSLSLRRKAGDYVHLEFTNARDFNNGDESIYYVGGFTQQAYLRAYLNLPSHETIETGDDKNGEFVAEKIVRKYTRSIVSRETRAMYNALSLLKLHDDVKILDEVGIEYTPQIGNIDVSIDWDTFDTGSLRIAFNEDGNVWTNSMDNIS